LLDLKAVIWSALMKSDRKKSLGKKGGAKPKASGSRTAKPGLAQQYEDLCRLRERVRALSEKSRAKDRH
jgi:hypothetical protein